MKNKKSSGEISPQILLLMGGIIASVVVAVIIFLVVFKKEAPPLIEEIKPKGPVTEFKSKNIKVFLAEAEDIGNILLGQDGRNPGTKDVTTTERFIKVKVFAENIGQEETTSGVWDIGEIVDNEGRKFPYSRGLESWFPADSQCGKNLKPGFTPVFCTRIYEVSKISEGMKIKIMIRGKTSEEGFIDLIDL